MSLTQIKHYSFTNPTMITFHPLTSLAAPILTALNHSHPTVKLLTLGFRP